MICPHCHRNTCEPTIDANHVINVVCGYFEIELKDLCTNKQTRRVYARQIIAYILREHGYTLRQIGILLNNAHHTTIMANIKQIQSTIRLYGKIEADIENIKKLLNN